MITTFAYKKANAQDVLNYDLLKAATDGDIEKAKSLITKGANINTKNSNGWTIACRARFSHTRADA